MSTNFFSTKYISVKGILTRYAISGNGETILFLHGFPETLQTWRHYPGYLAKDFRLVVFDLKGFGYSDKPKGNYSPWGMAEFVLDFMQILKIDSVYLVGTDIGLVIACAFALKYPEKLKKLILMAGTVYPDGIIAPEIKLLSIKPLGELILGLFGPLAIKMGLAKGFYGRGLISPEIFNEYYTPYKEAVGRKRTLELLRAFYKSTLRLAEEIKKITLPTLIIWAQFERFFALQAAKRLNKDIKDSRLKVISDCGHFIQEEKPKESAEAMLSFIRKN